MPRQRRSAWVNWEDYQRQQRLDRRARIAVWLIGAATVVACVGIWWGVRHMAQAKFGAPTDMSDIP
jgi:hypothetical protein